METISILIKECERLHEERKGILNRIKSLEQNIATQAANEDGWKIGDKINLKKCDKIITEIKFDSRSPYYKFFGARIKKNGEPYRESNEIYTWERV